MKRFFAATLSMSLATTLALFSNVALAENPNIARTASGEYSYINQDTNKVEGHEDWSLVVDGDGARTFTINQRWDENGSITMTIHRINADLRPVETYQTRWDKDGWFSSGVYTTVENTVNAVVTGRKGRATQTLEVPEGFSLVPHPLATDGLHFWYVDSPVGETIEGAVYNLRQTDPVTGAVLGVVHSVELTYLGTEDITTEAGTFATQHYTMGETSHFWVDARDGILVRLSYGPTGVRYDLTAYETGN